MSVSQLSLMAKVAVTMTVAVCAGCMRPRNYQEPVGGQLATVSFGQFPKVTSVYTFEHAASCEGKRYVPHGKGLAYVQVRVPAGQEVSLWVQSDITGSFYKATWCDAMFTFTPRADETYVLHAAEQAGNCRYGLTDAAGSQVAVRTRERITPLTDAGAWCGN
jgi:hypothetical protein